MNSENAQGANLKQKATHELVQLAAIFLYLAFFFCALTTYSMLLLKEFNVSYFTYGFALINALVIAKVILIGEYAHLGKKHESKPLLQVAVYKAFLFTLLVFGFHVVEEVIRLLLHRENMATALHEIRIDYSAVVSSYFALSLRSLHSGNCSGCWVRTTFEPYFSEQEQQRKLVSPARSERTCSRRSFLGRLHQSFW